jgi:thiamine pyrophosphate-dependent acetolactate synthase large subunit-like protein
MKLTGGQIVVETLIREGVPYIVGIPGHGTLGLSDALIEQRRGESGARPLKALQVRHEQATAWPASRWADSLAVFEPIAKRVWRPTSLPAPAGRSGPTK